MPLVNRDLGPCVIVWDPDGDNIVFSRTQGGVTFRYEELRAEIHEDQQGETVTDEVTTGATNPELEVPLAEEDLEKLAKIFANASSSATYLKVSNPVGASTFADAKEVIVKPIINGAVSVDTGSWLHIHRAYPRVNMEQPYDNSTQRVAVAIFKGFPDDESGQENEMWRLGPAA